VALKIINPSPGLTPINDLPPVRNLKTGADYSRIGTGSCSIIARRTYEQIAAELDTSEINVKVFATCSRPIWCAESRTEIRPVVATLAIVSVLLHVAFGPSSSTELARDFMADLQFPGMRGRKTLFYLRVQ
jgi:hypothetical protein